MRKGSRVERAGAGRAACVRGRKEDEARKGGSARYGHLVGSRVGRKRQTQLGEDWAATV